MRTARERLVSGHLYRQKRLKEMHRGENRNIASAARALQEAGRYASDFGRQALLFAGLILLVGIILAATTGNQTYARFIAWTGWFQN